MNKNVNVLAVLSRIEDKVSCSDFWDVSITDLLEARAAVAELIDSCESLQQHPYDLEIHANFCNALSRVKGG